MSIPSFRPWPHAVVAMAAALLLSGLPIRTLADAGHDHGEAAATATATALPRFAASSELFELVGVLDGVQLRLYLDHADSNAPVQGARLELELGGAKLVPTAVADAAGEFQATLAAPLAAGELPVTAMVTTATDSDLLAGELDIHAPEAHADDEHATAWPTWTAWAPWAAGALALAALAAIAVRRTRREGAAA